MMTRLIRSSVGVLLAAAFIVTTVATGGCDDAFTDPFVEGRHFTIYGFLNAFDVEHFVRVSAVRRFPEDIQTPSSHHAEIDARVTSTDLSTGQQHLWSHRLSQFADGSYGHVFSAAFLVHKGHRYELVVTRSDEAVSTAETTVPSLRNWSVAPTEIQGDTTTQIITWPGVSTPDDIDILYCAKPTGNLACSLVIVPYGRRGRRTEEGWEVKILLSRDLLFVRQQGGFGDAILLELAPVEMRFTALDEKWILPEGQFAPTELAQPDALTNVENGFGFWGSVSRSSANWTPEPEALAVSGFVPSSPANVSPLASPSLLE
jgi:hypothetical protein